MSRHKEELSSDKTSYKKKDTYLEFFPKKQVKEIRLDEAYVFLLLLGTLGAHQFCLGNRKRGCYLLLTCGISHLIILFTWALPLTPFVSHMGWKIPLVLMFSGYALGAPILVWDLFTLPWQVLKKKGNTTSF